MTLSGKTVYLSFVHSLILTLYEYFFEMKLCSFDVFYEANRLYEKIV